MKLVNGHSSAKKLRWEKKYIGDDQFEFRHFILYIYIYTYEVR